MIFIVVKRNCSNLVVENHHRNTTNIIVSHLIVVDITYYSLMLLPRGLTDHESVMETIMGIERLARGSDATVIIIMIIDE